MGKTMSTMLIVSIVALLLVLFGLGYLWLFRASKTARYRNYVKIGGVAARDYRWNEKLRQRHDRW